MTREKIIHPNDAYYLLGHTRALIRDRNAMADMIASSAILCRRSDTSLDEKLAEMVNITEPFYNKLDITRMLSRDGFHMVWRRIKDEKISVSENAPETIIQRPHAEAYKKTTALLRFIDSVVVGVTNQEYAAATEDMPISAAIENGRSIAERVCALTSAHVLTP